MLLGGFIRSAIRASLVVAVLTTAAGTYAYHRFVSGRVPAAETEAVHVGFCWGDSSLSDGPFPLTFEAYVKDRRGHNFFSGGKRAGLARRRFEWSHRRLGWIEDRGFPEREAASAKEREALARRPAAELVRDLRSDDPARREVSAKQLELVTNQTFGYAWDAPPDRREQAAEAWERWWADDANKLRYGAMELIETGQRALDTARKALEPATPTAPADGKK